MFLARLIKRLILSNVVISASSSAFFDTHLPLSAAETQKRIPMQHLATLDPSKLIPSLKIGYHTVQLSTNSEEDLVLSGQAEQGSWSVKLNTIYAMLPSELYKADLDGNGQQDLILLRPTASYRWANVNQSEDISLLLKTAKSTVNCQPVSWYSLFMLVVGEPKQREIISLAASPKTMQTALQKIIDQQYSLSVYGQRSTECSPEQVWAKAQP
ncbi:MAG: hypothetical protein WBP46_02900 [Thiolinea sp.]